MKKGDRVVFIDESTPKYLFLEIGKIYVVESVDKNIYFDTCKVVGIPDKNFYQYRFKLLKDIRKEKLKKLKL